MAHRLRAMKMQRYRDGFQLTLQPDVVELPLRWRKPRVVFVNSMSDLFHDDVPLDYLKRVFDVMARASQHTFQVLTKRAQRLEEVAPQLQWPRNVWMGVSVEDRARTSRIAHLQRVPAAVRFLSVEPLLEAIPALPLSDIQWVIVGGESGRKPRPMSAEWVTDIRDQCQRANVAFFFKQWGGRNKKAAGRALEGRTWDEMPTGTELCPAAK